MDIILKTYLKEAYGTATFYSNGRLLFEANDSGTWCSDWTLINDILYVSHDLGKTYIKVTSEVETALSERLVAELAVRKMLSPSDGT